MYQVFLSELYSPIAEHNTAYPEILASFSIFYYTRSDILDNLFSNDRRKIEEEYSSALLHTAKHFSRQPLNLTAIGIYHTLGNNTSVAEALNYLNQSIAISPNGSMGCLTHSKL